MVRVVCVADLHEHLIPVPACDLLVVAGDLTFGLGGVEDKRAFLAGPFAEWVAAAPARDVVVIAGNHDHVVEAEGFPAGVPCHYLQDSALELDGVAIWGTPWQPWFGDWAFNAPRDDGETFLAERFAAIPEATDVLVCHGPPLGYGDRAGGGRRVGSSALTDAVDRVRPRLLVCGHIHEDPGRFTRGETLIVNATIVDPRYEPANEPVVVDL